MTIAPRTGAVRQPLSTDRLLPLGAVVGPVLFTLAWLVLGYVSTGYVLFGHEFTDYSPISQPISGLGMGATAPYMNSAFVITGLLLVAGVIGVFRTVRRHGETARPAAGYAAVILLACTGVGQVLCGIFDLEAVMPHMLGFLLAVGIPVISFPVAGLYLRGAEGWQRFGTLFLIGSPLTLILLIGFFMTFQPTADGAETGIAGLVQRATVVEVHAWFVAMGWLAWRRSRSHA